MVEVMVAFVILLMCLAMVTTCMSLSSNLMVKAKDSDASNETLEEALSDNYTDTSDGGTANLDFGDFHVPVNMGTRTANGETFPIYQDTGS